MINLTPDTTGQFPPEQVKALQGLSEEIQTIFSENLAKKKRIKADKYWKGNKRYSAAKAIDGKQETYWAGEYQDFTGILELDLRKIQKVNLFELREPIHMGQRISRFKVEFEGAEGKWIILYDGTTIGYKRHVRFPAVTAQKFRVSILDARSTPLISEFGIYFNPYDKRKDPKSYQPLKSKTGTMEEGAI